MGAYRPSLIVHTTYFPITASDPSDERAGDPEREGAKELGEELYAWLTRAPKDPLAHGAGVPVRVATRYDMVDLREADHVVIVPVLGFDAHDVEPVRNQALAQMKEWASRLPSHHLLPVPFSEKWRASEHGMQVKQMLTELYAPGDKRLATLSEIVLGLGRALGGSKKLDMQLFISHAKADLGSTGQAAEKISTHVKTNTTGSAFFDTVSLLTGESLEDQIDAHAAKGVFLSVRGDAYSSRTWCQRELLQAKRLRLPTLTLEMLTKGEARSHPYGGNGPTMVWAGDDDDAAARVVLRAMIERVRATLFEAEAGRIRKQSKLPETLIAFSRPPELLDVPRLRKEYPGSLALLHPDPELSVHERDVLREAHPRMRLVTPDDGLPSRVGRLRERAPRRLASRAVSVR